METLLNNLKCGKIVGGMSGLWFIKWGFNAENSRTKSDNL